MTDTLKFALVIALAGLLIFLGWYVRGLQESAVQLQIERVKNEVATLNAEAIAKIRIESKTIYNKTVEKISTEVQYRDCVQDAEMLMLTNRALTGE